MKEYVITHSSSLWTKLKGKFVRPVAEAAGDREAEAKAALQEATGRVPDDESVEHKKQEVREDHGDVLPRRNR